MAKKTTKRRKKKITKKTARKKIAKKTTKIIGPGRISDLMSPMEIKFEQAVLVSDKKILLHGWPQIKKPKAVSTIITKYRVYLSNRKWTFPGPQRFDLAAQIFGQHKGKNICALTFGNTLDKPMNNYLRDDGVYRVFLPPERYIWCLDLLRNEGPIVFTTHEEDLAFWGLDTLSSETVGEGDG